MEESDAQAGSENVDSAETVALGPKFSIFNPGLMVNQKVRRANRGCRSGEIGFPGQPAHRILTTSPYPEKHWPKGRVSIFGRHAGQCEEKFREPCLEDSRQESEGCEPLLCSDPDSSGRAFANGVFSDSARVKRSQTRHAMNSPGVSGTSFTSKCYGT